MAENQVIDGMTKALHYQTIEAPVNWLISWRGRKQKVASVSCSSCVCVQYLLLLMEENLAIPLDKRKHCAWDNKNLNNLLSSINTNQTATPDLCVLELKLIGGFYIYIYIYRSLYVFMNIHHCLQIFTYTHPIFILATRISRLR